MFASALSRLAHAGRAGSSGDVVAGAKACARASAFLLLLGTTTIVRQPGQQLPASWTSRNNVAFQKSTFWGLPSSLPLAHVVAHKWLAHLGLAIGEKGIVARVAQQVFGHLRIGQGLLLVPVGLLLVVVVIGLVGGLVVGRLLGCLVVCQRG